MLCAQELAKAPLLQRALLAARGARARLAVLRDLFDVDALQAEGPTADVRPRPGASCCSWHEAHVWCQPSCLDGNHLVTPIARASMCVWNPHTVDA